MKRGRNEVGNVYSHLTVIAEAEKTGRLRRVWCRCECGSVKTYTLSSIRSGNTKSCGCIRRKSPLKGRNRPHNLNLIREVYERLTVIREVEPVVTEKSVSRRFECLCECGNLTTVFFSALRSGLTKSCGCLNRESAIYEDLTGREFDYLTVIERSQEISYRGRTFWLCRCKCGNTRIADSMLLKRGQITECSDECPYYVPIKEKCSIYAYSQRKYQREYYHNVRKHKKGPPTI